MSVRINFPAHAIPADEGVVCGYAAIVVDPEQAAAMVVQVLRAILLAAIAV